MADFNSMIFFDVGEAIIEDKDNGQIIVEKDLQMNSLSLTTSEVEIRGGRGNTLLALVDTDRDVSMSLRNALFSPTWLAMVTGTEWTANNNIVTDISEKVKVVVDSTVSPSITTGTVVATPAPNEVNVTVRTCDGVEYLAPLAGKVFTLPSALNLADGDEVTVYFKTVLEGDTLEIDGSTQARNWKLSFVNYAMEKCSGKLRYKVIFEFDNVRPSGSMDLSFEAGAAIAPEMTLRVMKSCCGDALGRVHIIDLGA